MRVEAISCASFPVSFAHKFLTDVDALNQPLNILARVAAAPETKITLPPAQTVNDTGGRVK